jgi:internalin A
MIKKVFLVLCLVLLLSCEASNNETQLITDSSVKNGDLVEVESSDEVLMLRVIGDEVKTYSEPNVSSESEYVLGKNTLLTVLSAETLDSSTWYKVKYYRGLELWLSSNAVKPIYGEGDVDEKSKSISIKVSEEYTVKNNPKDVESYTRSIESEVTFHVYDIYFNNDGVIWYQVIDDGSLQWIEEGNCVEYLTDVTEEIHDDLIVTFLDSNLQEAILSELELSSPIKYKDIKYVDELLLSGNIYKEEIFSLNGIQFFANLKTLDINNHDLIDVNPLLALDNLSHLELNGSNLENYNNIGYIDGLKFLRIGNCGLESVDFVERLSELEKLYVGNNKLKDLESLKYLSKLKSLSVDNNNITDISGLSYLKGLERLLLGNNSISDIEPISELENLKVLGLSNNKIVNIEPLLSMKNLESVDLSYNLITNRDDIYAIDGFHKINVEGNPFRVDEDDRKTVEFLDPMLHQVMRNRTGIIDRDITVGDLKELNQLHIELVEILDLEGLQYCENLRSLIVNGNFESVEQLSNMQYLEKLSIGSNALENVDALYNLNELVELNLGAGSIISIDGIENLVNLEVLRLWSENVKDFSPISTLTNLRVLTLRGNKIADITFVENLTKLEHLTLTENDIVDLTPLTGLERLKYLTVNSNEIVDIEPLRYLSSLEDLILVDNNITSVEPLTQLVHLKKLYLDRNPITDMELLDTLKGNLDTVDF